MSRKNTINFTKKALDNLPIPKGDSRPSYYDEQVNGLLIRVTSKGTKSYMVFRRINGVPKKNTLGTYPEMTIEQARSKAIKVLGLISEGVNPNKLKDDVISKHSITLQKVIDDYTVSKHNLKEDTVKDYLSILENYLSDWKKKPIYEISRDMVEQRHRDITYGTGKFVHKDGSPTRANKTMRVVRALFNYAIGQYEDSRGEPLFSNNPVARITHNKGWSKENIRQGVVQKHQLKKWYEGVIKLPLQDDNTKSNNSSEVVRDFLIFLIFTGLRRNEALTLKWSDIDFDNHSFTIEDTKNNESHSLPLTFVLDEVLERRKNDSDNPYVFQGSTPNGHLHPPKRQLERARELVGFHFDNHSLRRTFETTANRLALSTYTLKKLVNHKNTRDVTGRYIVLEIDELREPMKMISEALWSEMK
jgi:integrase|tara:strand:- start:1326 stop:2576 length:1251 start_codon:yes stop_codon:yes gene_type:complete